MLTKILFILMVVPNWLSNFYIKIFSKFQINLWKLIQTKFINGFGDFVKNNKLTLKFYPPLFFVNILWKFILKKDRIAYRYAIRCFPNFIFYKNTKMENSLSLFLFFNQVEYHPSMV